MSFYFELAQPEDDAELRRLLARNAMPGNVTVTFEREPDYFIGCGIMGDLCQVIIAREEKGGEIAAVMCRGIQHHYINGVETALGYIGQLRVDEGYRGRWIPSSGQSYLAELHKDGRVQVYFTVISDENKLRRLLLSSFRHGFPGAKEIGHIYTAGILLRKSVRLSQSKWQICRATPERMDEIVYFLNEQGKRKQLFPVYRRADFENSRALLDFKLNDLFIATDGDAIVGCLGLWDQSRYKQTVIQSYKEPLNSIRPLVNGVLGLLGVKGLPARGGHLHAAYASFVCVLENDVDIFSVLLAYVYNEIVRRGFSQLMLGLSVDDPLLAVAKKYLHIPYHSRIILLEPGDRTIMLDELIPYIEIATL